MTPEPADDKTNDDVEIRGGDRPSDYIPSIWDKYGDFEDEDEDEDEDEPDNDW